MSQKEIERLCAQSKFHDNLIERAKLAARIRALQAAPAEDTIFAPLHRQNYVPEKRIGFGWGLAAMLGMVAVCVAFALKATGTL